MKVTLDKVGKRFNYEWIFKNISFQFISGNAYAILGPNGSGKSTLLQLIAGNLSASEGHIGYHTGNKKITVDAIFNCIGFAAPYLELTEEFTLQEHLSFQARFKPFASSLSTHAVIDTLGMQAARNKMLRYFSSGMKQRVKLALAMLSDVPLVLLDEPATNLDEAGIAWYKNLVNDFLRERLLIICSNQAHEYDFCTQHLNMTDYKSM